MAQRADPAFTAAASWDTPYDQQQQYVEGGEYEEEEVEIRFCVNWNGLLEPLELPPSYTLLDLAKVLDSAQEASFFHKFFVFKGQLLHPSSTLGEAGIYDGSVLHLVLNDDPYRGRPLYIKDKKDNVKMILCGADYYIEDVKEELACMQGEPRPEDQRLVYAGRELQDQHTLREYNIQKPSVLICLGPGTNGRQLDSFLASVSPARDECNVALDASILIKFQPPEVNERHFWGQMLGGPDLSLISAKDIHVMACAQSDKEVAGNVSVDLQRHEVMWTPTRPLSPATRYLVTINKTKPGEKTGALRHNRAKEAVQGVFEWDMFTEGYQPLRVTAVYPRPHSRVRCCNTRGSENAIIVSFSNDILPTARPGPWVTVRGHELEPPLYDPSSKSLVFRFAEPLMPNEICRVRIREHLVRGANGESLFPRQQDGMLRTSTFRWKFYSGETSIYEEHNMASSGVSRIMRRLHQGLLLPLDGSQMVPEASLRSVGYMGGDARMMQAAGLPGYGGGGGQRQQESPMDWLNPANLLGLGGVFDQGHAVQEQNRALENGGSGDGGGQGEWKF